MAVHVNGFRTGCQAAMILFTCIFAHVHSDIMRKRKKGVGRKQRGDWERRRRKEAINKERRNTLNVEKGEEI